MSLLVDGAIQSTLTQTPYDFTLDIFPLSAGPHTLTARITDRAGNQTDTTSVPVTIQGQLGIRITSPADGTTIDRSRTIIKGKVYQNENKEKGVVVNGILAQVQGNDFAAIVPLNQGQNSITATETDADGRTAQSSVTITTNNPIDQIRITVNPESGIPMTKPDGTTSFDTTMSAETSLPYLITNYSWDTNGDGTPEQTGMSLNQITATYQSPGLYFPTVTVTDILGNTYTETAIVNVIDRNALDALLKAKWEGMKAALGRGDIEGALNYFVPESKSSFRKQFAVISQVLPQFVAALSEANVIKVYPHFAECDFRIVKDGVPYSFQLLFVRDTNGLWKIMSF